MKILVVNSRYFPSAGPEKYLFSISQLLEERGHEVIPFSLKNRRNLDTPYSRFFADNIGGADELYFEEMDSSLSTRFQILDRQFYSLHVKRKLQELIEATEVDIAYILHHQNRLSPSVIDACVERNLPVIVRISDFSLVCTRGSLSRDGRVCELCLTHGLRAGIRHKCVKGSFVGSTVKALALASYRWRGIYHKVNRIVVPSRFTIEKLDGVLQREKMTYLPTLVLPEHEYRSAVGDYALFVGRVEEEKGLIYALKAFEQTRHPLKIVGYSHSGYGEKLRTYVRQRRLDNIEFLGPRFGAELDEVYRNSRFVILPVIWYENLPNVALEAMLHSKPVVASDIGSMREVVSHNQTGLLFEAGNSNACSTAIKRLFEDEDLVKSLGAEAYRRVTTYYSAEKHYDRLTKVFSDALRGPSSLP